MRRVLLILFLLIHVCINAQVYVYEPIRHSNFETNPAFLANQRYTGLLSLSHQGRFPGLKIPEEKISYDGLKCSYYSKKRFVGIGLSANNITFANNTRSSTFGIGTAYRVILLNKFHARIGAMIKLNSINNSGGSFSEYHFNKIDTIPGFSGVYSNLNTSISLSTPHERLFMSLAALNINLNSNSEKGKFVAPRYYILNAGDLGKLMECDNNEITFTGFIKISGTKKTFQQQINSILQILPINRNTTLMIGFVVAYNSDEYFLLRPSLLLYRREVWRAFRNCRPKMRDTGVFRVQYDFAIPLNNNPIPFKSSLQFSYAKIF